MESNLKLFQSRYKDFIGVPYEKEDCWRIAVKFYKIIFGIPLHHYFSNPTPEKQEEIESLIYTNRGDFEKVEKPEFGDLILISILGIESHLAVYLYDDVMLHTKKKTGSVLEKMSKYKTRITGFYRLREHFR